MFGVPFVHLPLDKDLPDGKAKQEAAIEEVLLEHKIDVLILARYMQILSPEFCTKHATVSQHQMFQARNSVRTKILAKLEENDLFPGR